MRPGRGIIKVPRRGLKMDFLDFIVAVAVIGVLVFVCFNIYSHVIWSDAVIKWKGVQTTAEVVDSTTARTRLASLYHSKR